LVRKGLQVSVPAPSAKIPKKDNSDHASDVFSNDDVEALADAAQSNPGEFHIESILEHRGMPKKRKTFEFLVRWTGYDPSYDTWEPWDNLKQTAPLISYLKKHRELQYLVRKEDR
jgi:hypothetical protein